MVSHGACCQQTLYNLLCYTFIHTSSCQVGRHLIQIAPDRSGCAYSTALSPENKPCLHMMGLMLFLLPPHLHTAVCMAGYGKINPGDATCSLVSHSAQIT
jgi:hypothetical protein